jgi:hypothetical protein
MLYGGIFVAAFSLVGEIVMPKRLAGVFGGAPSVACASILLTIRSRGPQPVPAQMGGMVLGTVGFLGYVIAYRLLSRRLSAPAAAFLSWGAWFGCAGLVLLVSPR